MNRFLYALLTILVMATCVNAQERGALTNVYASWVNVTFTQVTVTSPFNSRDLTIINGSPADICVSPKGSTIGASADLGVCRSSIDSYVFVLPANEQVTLYDYITGSVTARTSRPTINASPVSVIFTY